VSFILLGFSLGDFPIKNKSKIFILKKKSISYVCVHEKANKPLVVKAH